MSLAGSYHRFGFLGKAIDAIHKGRLNRPNEFARKCAERRIWTDHIGTLNQLGRFALRRRLMEVRVVCLCYTLQIDQGGDFFHDK